MALVSDNLDKLGGVTGPQFFCLNLHDSEVQSLEYLVSLVQLVLFRNGVVAKYGQWIRMASFYNEL